MSDNLEFTVKDETRNVPIKVLYLKGEINSNTKDSFQEKGKELHANGAENLLLDFTDVTFMSSAGLRVIHAIYQLYHGEHHDTPEDFKSPNFKLVNVPENIMRVIRAVGIDTQISVFDGHQAAVDSF